MNKIKNWIPAFAGMTTLSLDYDTVSIRGRGMAGYPDGLRFLCTTYRKSLKILLSKMSLHVRS